MSDVVERRVVEVVGKIDQNFARQLNEINKQLGTMKTQIKGIQDLGSGAITGFFSAQFLQTLVQVVDQQAQMKRSLEATLPATVDLKEAQRDLLDLSLQTQRALVDTTALYTRLTIATSDLDVNQKQVMDTVEAFNLAMLKAGTGMREASAASTQFGQALASGKLQGDEFRSIMENVPVLARVLADNLEDASGKLGVTVGELRELSKAGELTTTRVIEALTRGLDDLQKSAASLPRTIGQSVEALGDSLSNLVGKIDQAYGASSKLASLIASVAKLLNDNSEAIARVAGPAGFGLLAAGLVAVGVALAPVLASIGAFIVAVGPMAAAVGGAVAVIARLVGALGELADQLNVFGAADVSLDDVLRIRSKDELIEAMNEITAKMDELREKRNQFATMQGQLIERGASPGGTGAIDAQLRAINGILAENAAAFKAQAAALQEAQDRLDEYNGLGDKTAETFQRVREELDKFRQATAGVNSNIGDLQAQYDALTQGVAAYDKVVAAQKRAVAEEKIYQDIVKAGLPAGKMYETAARELAAAQVELAEALEQRVEAQKELEKFQDKSDEEFRKVEALKAQLAALEHSTGLLNDLTQAQERNRKVEEARQALLKAGNKDIEDELALYAKRLLQVDRLTAALEKQKKVQEAQKKLASDNAERAQEIRDLEEQVTALQQSQEAYDKVVAKQQEEAEVRKVVNEQIQAGNAMLPEELRALEEQVAKREQLRRALEEERDIRAGLATVDETSQATVKLLESLRDQVEAYRQGEEAVKDLKKAQEEEEYIEKRLLEAKKAGIDVSAALAQQYADEAAEITRLKDAIEEMQGIQEGRRAFTEGAIDLSAQIQAIDEQVEAARKSDAALESVKRNQEAATLAQEQMSKLSEADTAERERQADIIAEQTKHLVDQKALLDKIQDDRRKAEQEAEKRRREARQREIAEEQELWNAVEKAGRLSEGPIATIKRTMAQAKAEHDQLMVFDEEERRLAKDKYEDEQKLADLVMQARRMGITLSEEFIAQIGKEIAATSEQIRANEKLVEQLEEINAVRKLADPTKELRDKAEAIRTGMDNGAFNEDEMDAANRRLYDYTLQMNKLYVVSQQLAEMDNPFAGLVQATAQVQQVFSETFKNMNFADQMEAGGQAALGVLQGITDTMRMLNIENFEVQKGIAIAQATINAALAITKVLAEGGMAGIVMAGAIAAIAGAQIAIIASQEPPKRALGGPVMAGSMYQVGERGIEMFTSASGKNYMIPGQNGTVTPNNKLGGGNVIIQNNGPPVTVTGDRTNENGDRILTIQAATRAAEKKFEDSMANGYGGYSRAIRRNVVAARRV